MDRHDMKFAFGLVVAGLLLLAFAVPALAADPIRIGAPLSLTGTLADEGAKEQQGLDMCIDAVNAKGGVKVGAEQRKLEATKYDYQSETSRAVQIVQRLLTVDKVDFLFAPYGSGDTKATAVLAERYNVPMIATSAASDAVYDQKQKNLFGILFPSKAMAEVEAKFYKARMPEAKKIAVFALNSLFPKAMASEVRTFAAKDGFEVVYDGLYSQGTLDFANVLTQIKAGNPDWLYVTGYIQELILIRRQMANLRHERAYRDHDGWCLLSGVRAEISDRWQIMSQPMRGGIQARHTRTATSTAARKSTAARFGRSTRRSNLP